MTRLSPRKPRLLILAAFGVALLGLGGGGAALCKFAVNCHLRAGSSSQQLAAQLDALARRDATVRPRVRPGLRDPVVARGLSFPTDFAFLPDGSALVAERDGLIRVVAGGRVLARPFLDLRSRVDTSFFRGVMAIAADPEFRSNHFVYVLYTEPPAVGPSTSPTSMRLVRVTAAGTVARAGTLRVLLGRQGGRTCGTLRRGADCLPSDKDHDGGGLAFARDGTLFVSTGDGGGFDSRIEQTALAAQDLDSLSGKVLRITRDGRGVASNPFWNGDPDANRSKVWAYGFRNPFRLTLAPRSGRPVVGDVGALAHEEIDVVAKAGNYGWPCYEGTKPSHVYRRTALCRRIYAGGRAAVRRPAFTYPHVGSVAVTGGAFSTGRLWRGEYVFGDWVRGWLKVLHLSRSGTVIGKPRTVARKTSGPVAIRMGPGHDLYYLSFDTGELRRIMLR